MLACASSDAGTRLRRSKSTSNVHRHAPSAAEVFNADVAQQHALVAATVAFNRSQAQSSIERQTKHSSDLGRSKSTASRKSLKQGSHFPPRELSIRSVPPKDSGRTRSIHRLSQASAITTKKFPPFEPTSTGERPVSSARPLSAQASVTSTDYGRPGSQSKSHRQSTASSITSQQIRKARSMYYASSVQTGSPIARPPAKYLATPSTSSPSPALSAAPTTYVPNRSIGPSPLAVPPIPVTNDTVNNARDKYLQDFQQRPIKHKPSLFLAPFKKRRDKADEQGKRVSAGVTMPVPSTNYQPAVANITVSDFMPQSTTKDRRSFSGSLKRKIKRVFRRSSNKSPGFPVQQIEASRDYYETTTVTPLYTDQTPEIPEPDEELLQRIRARTPPLDEARPRILRSASRSSGSNTSARSNRSLHSEANTSYASASRVTSWGTSASEDTLAQRAIKRLTVIHEAKDSISSITDRVTSVSAQTKRKSLLLPALSAFRDPMHMESLPEEVSTPPPVDPKRVFSALMREIDASEAAEVSTSLAGRTSDAEIDVFASSQTKGLNFTNRDNHSSVSTNFATSTSSDQKTAAYHSHSIQSKKSSIRLFGRAIRSTVRTVMPGEHRSSPRLDLSTQSEEHANVSSDDSPGSQETKESRTAIFSSLRISKKKYVDPIQCCQQTHVI
jgi:hypothetical protein